MTYQAIVQVMGALNVKIRPVTIQGPGGGGCDSIGMAFTRRAGSGSAPIEKGHITHIRDNAGGAPGWRHGVDLGRAREGTLGSGAAKDGLIDDQRGGIVIKASSGSDAAWKTILWWVSVQRRIIKRDQIQWRRNGVDP